MSLAFFSDALRTITAARMGVQREVMTVGYLGLYPAARKFGVSRSKIRSLALMGLVRVARSPGEPVRYCIADIAAVLERSNAPVGVVL